MPPDFDTAYRAMSTRDARFDGQFITAVKTTGIYCRPACPSRTPLRENVTFYATPAAAQAAGFRACRRCLPDAAPGSPEWNIRADTVGAAMRLIGDGVVDREGVVGLAHRLGYSQRHLARLLITEIGAPPVALARAKRADTARVLLSHTDLPVSEIAYAAGFSSIRQFNDTIREVYATSPSALRDTKRSAPAAHGTIDLRLPVRTPFDGAALLAFLAARAITGVERVDGRSYARTLRLPHGTGTVLLTMPQSASTTGGRTFVAATLTVDHIQDLAPAVARCRRLLDADADPQGIAAALSADPALAGAVADAPGLRLPGAVDGPEILMRALVGQQVSVAAARTALGKLTAAADERIDSPVAGLTHLFPSPAAIAALGPDRIGGPRRRAAAIAAAAEDLAAGRLTVDAGRRTDDLTADLVTRAGIGPWTAGYIAMRVLGDPDVLLTGDLALRHGAAALGLPSAPRDLAAHAERWRPFRSYAGMYLWRSCPRSAARRPAATDPHPEGPELI
jgi:AraC family transcriptional regulator, regulatory protein of adaptative response / DNA-3-methyladenine glycosylase II